MMIRRSPAGKRGHQLLALGSVPSDNTGRENKPVMTSLILCESSCPLKRSASPTITSPRMVMEMPIHWLGTRRRPRKATESRPVKMMTAPRNIWKLEALVMLRATTRDKRKHHIKNTKMLHSPGPIVSTFLPEVLTDIHDGGGRHVTHGRREKEERIEALAWVHLGFWASSVATN